MADIKAWYEARGTAARLVLIAALGAIAGTGQAPTDFWPLSITAIAILFLIWSDSWTPRKAGLMIWLFGIGYFAVSLRWIVEPFLVDVTRHGWMAPFAMVLMAAGAGLFWALAGWLAAWLRGGVFGLALGLVFAEFARAYVLTGFPWALLGHIWIDTPLAQVASLGGPHLLTLLTVTAAMAVASLIGRWRLVGLVWIGLLIAIAFVLRPPPLSQTDGPLVRLVQPNAPQSQKWDPAYRDVFLNRLMRLTSEGDRPDLVVWPETAVPYLLNQLDEELMLFSDAARGAPLVFGIQRYDEDFRYYNSLVVMGQGGVVTSIYDKQHLVPFGEYIPGARLLSDIGMPGLAGNLGLGFTPGSTPGPVMLPGIGPAIPLICYEGIFAEEITSGATRPRLLLLITNDAWFGDAAGPSQHLAQARLRAIEQGLPMVRVANTGISAMIDPYGRVVAQLPLGVEGAINAPLPAAREATPYSRFSDLPAIVLLSILLLGAFVTGRREYD
ncbi:apolipoprotein N-acyltransferase [Yoonia litorea]|uniref:Apolipoprotein N-acyltransferase n=1 Tax=Yoonia litorea TaxID=1123755 RepID=A0A1I6LEJ7_9RHOB|nr:apolipoprotein N-acyltransferase [Yoonia litorea]SFS01896.1 apolipoprotein N-acyltransferase [Yoonia litorea]